jgi:hypothetical protein
VAGSPFPCLAGDPPPRAAMCCLPLACPPPFLHMQMTRAVGSASNGPDRVNPASIPVNTGSNPQRRLRVSLAPDREINGPDQIGAYPPLRSVHCGPMDRVHRRSTVGPASPSMINGVDRAQHRSTQSPSGYFAKKPPRFS